MLIETLGKCVKRNGGWSEHSENILLASKRITTIYRQHGTWTPTMCLIDQLSRRNKIISTKWSFWCLNDLFLTHFSLHSLSHSFVVFFSSSSNYYGKCTELPLDTMDSVADSCCRRHMSAYLICIYENSELKMITKWAKPKFNLSLDGYCVMLGHTNIICSHEKRFKFSFSSLIVGN